MVVKMGYTGEYGIEMWRYLDNLDDIKITGFEEELYYVVRNDKGIGDEKKPEFRYFYRKYTGKRDGANVPCDDVEVDLPCVWFNTDILKQEGHMMWLTMIFVENNNVFACMADSVYLMNENGKTVDKY